MFFDKIRNKKSGVLLYGITPPKSITPTEKVQEIAERTMERLYQLPIDALIVYDVQDESARTTEERPFPYVSALDPLEFTKNYLSKLQVPKIIYRPAGKFTPEELTAWLDELHRLQFYPVFVGVPAPDFKVKTSLQQAYQIWSRHKDSSVIGAVTIPERHEVLKDEDIRIFDKMRSGVGFFVSQCVFNVDYATRMTDALVARCASEKVTPPTLIFTLTACGSPKTLQFMEWLGIHVPETVKNDLLQSEQILQKSVSICIQIAEQLIKHCRAHHIPFGFNIESVAIRKEEIEASIQLVHTIHSMLQNP